MKNKTDEELKNGRKFNKRPHHEDTGEVSSSDHGIIVSWNSLQHHGHGVDRTSWLQGSGGSRRRGNVYLAFPGAGVHGAYGRTGSGRTVHRAR